MEIGGRICEFIAMKTLVNRTFLFLLLTLIFSSCANLFHREVLLHTWEQHTIGKYKFVHGQYGHFPRRYDAYRLYKIRKNDRDKILTTTDFKYLDSAKCIIYFEINDRRKIYFDLCKKKRLSKKELE
jgi:hypothetical protein